MNIASPLGHERNYHTGSLMEQIEDECLSSVTDNARISSLILKFYYLCVTGENPENPVSYSDMESVYHDSQLQLLARRTIRLGNNPFLPTESALKIIRDYPRFWNHVQSVGNELRMIGDIPATTLIFRDIIERVITSDKHREMFVGLDLGTGTGILVLAMYILARKNSCDAVRLYGISNSEFGVDHVRSLMQKISCPASIIEADTREKHTYQELDAPHISLVCNENIPRYTEGIHAEPFFHNLIALRESRMMDSFKGVQFFPSGVNITCDGTTTHTCSPDNEFLIDMLGSNATKTQQFGYSEVQISGGMVPLRDFHLRAAKILGLPPCHSGTTRW